jgi:hypothetical protein
MHTDATQRAVAQANAEADASAKGDDGLAQVRPAAARVLHPLSAARALIIRRVLGSVPTPEAEEQCDEEAMLVGCYVCHLTPADAWAQARAPRRMYGAALAWADTLPVDEFQRMAAELQSEAARLGVANATAEAAVRGGGEADPTSPAAG